MKQVTWFTIDRLNRFELPGDTKVNVDNYLITADGWCQEAELTIQGDKNDLRQLLNLLWYKLEILGETGTKLWWGFVSRIELYLGRSKLVVDLQEVNNSIAVAYTMVDYLGNTLGVRYTTVWQNDQESIDRYGLREMLLSGPSLNTVAAEALAKCKLDEMSLPIINAEPLDGDAAMYAKVYCEGDWRSLDARYCYVPPSLALSYQTIGAVDYTLLPSSQIAQSFTMTSEINAIIASLYVKRVGTPGDLQLSITRYIDAMTPGEAIASITINKNLIGTEYGWISGQLQTGVHLTAGSQYFLVIKADFLDTGNYYSFKLDANKGYGNGSFIIKMESGNWISNPADLPFRIYKTNYLLGLTSSSNQGSAPLNLSRPGYLQTFTAGSAAVLRAAKLYIKRIGTPGDLNVAISSLTGSSGLTDTDNASLPFSLYKSSQIAAFTNPSSIAFLQFTSVWTNYAQSFRPTSNVSIREVRFYLQKFGTPGALTISVGGKNGVTYPLLASKTVDPSLIGTSASWVSVLFDSDVVLEANWTYFIYVTYTNATSTNYYSVGRSPADEYAGGNAAAYSTAGAQWYAQNYDFMFVANSDTLGVDYSTYNSGVKKLGYYLKQLVQPVVSSTTIDVLRYGLYIRKVGTPGPLKLELLSRTDNYPGAALLDMSIDQNLVPTTAGWFLIFPSKKVTLTSNVVYYLSVTGEGCDTNNYYEVQWDTNGGYSGGKLLFTPVAIGTALDTATIESNKVGTTSSWVGGMFGKEINLTAGQAYVLTLSCTNLNESNYYEISFDQNKGYTSGTMLTFVNNKYWSESQDFLFEIDTDTASVSFDTYNSVVKKLGFEWMTVAQSFLVSSNIELSRFAIYTRKIGTPGKLNVSIYSLESGHPGEVLISGSLDPINVSNEFGLNFLFPKTILNLVGGTSYCLVLSAQDCSTSNYYELKVDNNGGFTSGSLQYSLSEGWSDGNADLPFRVYCNENVETTQQIANILTTFGQTLLGVKVLSASQIFSDSFRNGDSTALSEVNSLLELGTINNRRLIARVNHDQTVDIWEQAEEPNLPLFELHDDGHLYYSSGELCPEGIVPIGEWISIQPILYESLQSNNALSRSAFPCKAVSFQDGRYQYVRGNIRNPYSERVQNG